MDFEVVKVEIKYEPVESEHEKSQSDYLNDFEIIKTEKKECNNINHLISKEEVYESQEDLYECDRDGLLQLVTVRPYDEDYLQFKSEQESRTVSDNLDVNINAEDIQLSSLLNSDSFQIFYMNEDENSRKTRLRKHQSFKDTSESTEEITIIGCDPVELPYVETNPNRKEMGRAVPEINWYKCKICQFKTSKKTIYEKHVNEHVGLGKLGMFKCTVCNFKTIYPFNLKKHVLRHGENKAFHCNLCSYKANLRDALHDHMINVHLKKNIKQNRMYHCLDCDYSTKYVSNFKRHSNSCHENLLKCKLCDFKTTFKHKFVEHCLSHEKVKDTSLEMIQDTVYQCELCTYETKKANCLNIHNKKYHPLETNVSTTENKSNSSNQQFKVINANNLKVFRCVECGHSTTDPSNFNRHLKRHRKNDSVTLFQCFTCGLKTKYKLNLVKHITKHRLEGKMIR